MTKLIEKVKAKFGGEIKAGGDLAFNFGEDTYLLTTDNNLYATLDCGTLLPGQKKVRGLVSVEKFVAARA